MPTHQVAIHWFRRDLRLTDNPALQHAARIATQVIPVYILSTWQQHHGWTGPARQQFLCGSLDSLSKNLESIGSRLILRVGQAEAELEKLIHETGATALFWNRDYDPYGRAVEARLRALCARLGITCHDHKDRVLHEPEEALTGSGTPYRVYTPYSRNWLNLEKPLPEGRIKSLGPAAASTLPSHPLPTLQHWHLTPAPTGIPEPGEKAARQRMKDFIEARTLHSYQQQRDTPAGTTTSRLGQDLRFGLISIRELHARCQQALTADTPPEHQLSIHTYIKELAWREFYLAILWHYPHVFEEEFSPDFRGMAWPGREDHFHLWCQGLTGFPIVDAGMRQLLATGFMHNRVRMITAMFLTKDLHCDWRLGEGHFMRHLVDGENASNNGGWQWSAGTGADAAPYFRIQNPWTQSQRHDPEARYIKTWLPELTHIHPRLLHQPPPAGRPLTPGYPAPIVDHSTERDRTLALFAQHKDQRR